MCECLMDQRGRAPILLIVITATLALGLAASAYLNYNQFQHATQTQHELQGQITDLRYQLHVDEKQPGSPAPGASPGAGAAPAPSPTPAVLGAQTVDLTQLGVKLTVGDPIADLTYDHEVVGSLDVANLTTSSLVAKYPACKPGAALGMVVRRPLSSKPSSSSTKFLKTFGKYNFYYVPPTSNCGGTVPGQADVTAAKSALVNTVLPTLSQ